MKILLLGANGQIGKQLDSQLPSVGEVKSYTRSDCDITNARSVIKVITEFKPTVIVNAAAYTAVDKAEGEEALTYAVNADSVNLLAQEAAKRDIWLIHYSTDYVFDGNKSAPYTENDVPNPINIYGASKLAGEKLIVASACKYFIFRTTWIIGKDGTNFAKTILQLAIERDKINVINDQYGVPTSPSLISKVTLDCINAIACNRAWPSGIYHLAPQGETTWHDMTKTLLKLAEDRQVELAASAQNVRAISAVEYPRPAKRPLNSRLDTQKIKQQLTFNLPNWQDDFLIVAAEIIENLKQHET